MDQYPFRLLNSDVEGPLADKKWLQQRPSQGIGASFADDAKLFIPGEALETAINTAIAVSEPLLITGEPGTGKTQSAYYTAYKLGIEPVIHFQVKSDSTAKDLLYHFDTIRYFHDAHLSKEERKEEHKLDKKDYVEPRALWQALNAKEPRILLIDEIDKAPRDFPNDLLLELDKLEFTVTETGEKVRCQPQNRPIIFITSNSERRLPEPFLRRCVYHHIPFDRDLIFTAVNKRQAEFPRLSHDFIQMAIERFLALREANLRKPPSTAELLIWLRVLGINENIYSQHLDENLAKLPHLGALIKDHQDLNDL